MALREDVIEALRTVLDPELYIDVWTLGLIYGITISDEGHADVQMTFTTPACPAGPHLVQEVKEKVESVEGVSSANVQVVFEPPWEPSEDLKAMMGIL